MSQIIVLYYNFYSQKFRRYVEKELFDSSDAVPEKHNLSYFPTVNDLQNHIHQALKDIEKGVLPVTAPHCKYYTKH